MKIETHTTKEAQMYTRDELKDIAKSLVICIVTIPPFLAAWMIAIFGIASLLG